MIILLGLSFTQHNQNLVFAFILTFYFYLLIQNTVKSVSHSRYWCIVTGQRTCAALSSQFKNMSSLHLASDLTKLPLWEMNHATYVAVIWYSLNLSLNSFGLDLYWMIMSYLMTPVWLEISLSFCFLTFFQCLYYKTLSHQLSLHAYWWHSITMLFNLLQPCSPAVALFSVLMLILMTQFCIYPVWCVHTK